MIRKQIYIQPHQNAQLKRVAKARAMTEAEVIREALEIVLKSPAVQQHRVTTAQSDAAWQKILQFIEQRRREGVPGEHYTWKREDAYDDERYQRPWAMPANSASS